MPGIREDLPNEEREGAEGLNVTEEEVWELLDDLMGLPEDIQPGDVTLTMVADRYKICDESARSKMNELVRKGLFERVKLRLGGKVTNVYRKVQRD